jgi:hypothetical protein
VAITADAAVRTDGYVTIDGRYGNAELLSLTVFSGMAFMRLTQFLLVIST